MAPSFQPDLIERASRIRLLALDVDGVLTPGTIVYTEEGVQVQSFHVQDGLGIRMVASRAGVEVAVISSRHSKALSIRAGELGISRVHQGVKDKLRVYRSLLQELGLEEREVAYVGDDWVDLPILKRVGLSVAVGDAASPLKDHVHFVTTRPGGKGAVREVCDLILAAKGLWDDLLQAVP